LLSKCLNPKCSAQFRYLHEGKLFCLAIKQNSDLGVEKSHAMQVDYVWMCNSCSRIFEPTREAGCELTVKRRSPGVVTQTVEVRPQSAAAGSAA